MAAGVVANRFLVGWLTLGSCATVGCGKPPTLDSEEQKTIYAMGAQLGERVRPLELSPSEVASLRAGLDDALE